MVTIVKVNRRILLFSVVLHVSFLSQWAAVTSTSAAVLSASALEADQQQQLRRREGRRLVESLSFTQNSSNDDDSDDSDDNDTQSSAQSLSTNGTNVCSPVAECELCPHNWKVLVEKEDEKIKGEYDSCVKYGRRRQFECTVLYQGSKSSKKIARTLSEYRSCRYTEVDEQYRMLRMQIICLLVGVWAMRNVQRQKVTSASLFDQRRMRNQNGSTGKHVKYAPLPLQRKDSIGTHEMVPLTRGLGKVPKSPAPDPNMESVI